MKLLRLKNEAGQATMEAVLLMIAFTFVALKATSYAKDNGLIANVVEGPWSPIRGMIEDGVWKRHTDSKSLHPNHRARHQSREGDTT